MIVHEIHNNNNNNNRIFITLHGRNFRGAGCPNSKRDPLKKQCLLNSPNYTNYCRDAFSPKKKQWHLTVFFRCNRISENIVYSHICSIYIDNLHSKVTANFCLPGVWDCTGAAYFNLFCLLNLTPVQTEYTWQSHIRTVQPDQGWKG